MIGLIVVLLMSFTLMMSMVLVIWGFKGQNYVALLQESEMSAELHSRSLKLGVIYSIISTLNM